MNTDFKTLPISNTKINQQKVGTFSIESINSIWSLDQKSSDFPLLAFFPLLILLPSLCSPVWPWTLSFFFFFGLRLLIFWSSCLDYWSNSNTITIPALMAFVATLTQLKLFFFSFPNVKSSKSLFSSSFFPLFCCGVGVWTQDLIPARQVLSHLSHASSLFLLLKWTRIYSLSSITLVSLLSRFLVFFFLVKHYCLNQFRLLKQNTTVWVV
jgi:hypothetical protein